MSLLDELQISSHFLLLKYISLRHPCEKVDKNKTFHDKDILLTLFPLRMTQNISRIP
jgi:hypothetical protein